MTLTNTESNKLTLEEWDELVALKNAINYNLSSVHPDEQERFTQLFVKSLAYVGNADS